MTMYQCRICGTTFDRPNVIERSDPTVDIGYMEHLEICPVCGQPHIEEMEECPECGGPMPRGEIICKTCRDALRVKFREFLAELSPREWEQIDEWLDGRSVAEAMGHR